MPIQLGGLHHVSAITGDTGKNVDFYTRVLGLRLVKKTVNQDDVASYHLFYGDEVGHAGTEITFFAFKGAVQNVPGTGAISTIALAVPTTDSLDWWQERFETLGVRVGDRVDRGGRDTLPFTDFEGQSLALIAINDADQGGIGGEAWDNSTIPTEHQILGMYAIETTVAEAGPSAATLTDTLGFREVEGYKMTGGANTLAVRVFESGPGGPGTEMHIVERPGARLSRPGAGGVHHVAFRTPTVEEHAVWREHINADGYNVTPQIDRFYFRSIYFREPGHVLYEIATDGPGFATDEDVEHLGESLALPPFLEPYREQIEAGLDPIIVPDQEVTSTA